MNSSTTTPTTLSASRLAQAIAAGELSAVEAVEAHIARIEEVNPRLNAVVVPLFDDARARAQQADRTPAGERGPLHGVPITVKECFDVTGTPSTAGLMAELVDRHPSAYTALRVPHRQRGRHGRKEWKALRTGLPPLEQGGMNEVVV